MIDNSKLQLGTKENPFRELNQALSTIKNYKANIINIHLADGTYNTNLGDISPQYLRASNIIQNFNKTIIINGNNEDNTKVIIKGINARNVKNLIAQNLTIYNQYRNAFELYNTNAYINNCIITNPDLNNNYDGVYANNANIYINDSKFDYVNNVINGLNANIRCNNIVVNSFVNLYPSTIRASYMINSISFLNENNQYTQKTFYDDYKKLRQIYINNDSSPITSNDDEIELPIDITDNIKNLKVLLTSSSKYQKIVDIRYPNTNKDFPFNIVLGSDNYYYNISGLLSFEGNKIKITNQQQLRISKSDGTMQWSPWNNFHYFRIVSVWIDENY